MQINKLNDNFSFTAQITADDIAELAKLGFKTIINNRPDGESENQPSSAELAAAAQAHQLNYVHIPVIPNNIQPAQVQAFQHTYQTSARPIIGFCKTGNRASSLCRLALEEHDD